MLASISRRFHPLTIPLIIIFSRPLASGWTPKLILKREEIQMHHGSYIRNNVRVKLQNSSASINFNKDIDRITNHYENWKYPEKVLWGGAPSTLHTVKKVENLFK